MFVQNHRTNDYKGAGFEYCLGPQSYASSSWMKNNIQTMDQHIWLNWCTTDSKRHFETKFIVIDFSDSLDCDYMLGNKCRDAEYNRKENTVCEPSQGKY